MNVISVTNRKGGVGKTTMSVHIAAGLAHGGMRVGLVDTDSQGHAGLMLGMQQQDGLYDALIHKKPIEEVVQHVAKERYSTKDNPAPGELWLLPSYRQTFLISHNLGEHETFSFYETMEAFTSTYQLDAVIVDTNPSLSKLDSLIWLGTDGFIYVTELNRLSIDGVEQALLELQRFTQLRQRYLNRATHVLGVIANKTQKMPKLHRNNKKTLEDTFGQLLWEPVPRSILWEEACNDFENPQTMYTYAPSSNEAKIAMKLATNAWKAITERQDQG